MRRKWRPSLRFSLRTALIVITLISIWLAFHVRAAQRQRHAVETIRAAGGWVGYDYAWENGDWVKGGGESWVPNWLTKVAGEDAFHDVVAVNLAALFHSAYDENGPYTGPDPEAVVSDELWEAIKIMRSTEWLSLNARNISDDELRHLSGLKCLTELKMEAVPIKGNGLQHLLSLPSLRYLNISRIHITDEHAQVILKFKHLTELAIIESTISPGVAKELERQMPGCKHYYEHWPPEPDPSSKLHDRLNNRDGSFLVPVVPLGCLRHRDYF